MNLSYEAIRKVADAIRRDPSFPGQVYDAYDPETATVAVTVDGVPYWLTMKQQG
jgi:hypothetical protein